MKISKIYISNSNMKTKTKFLLLFILGLVFGVQLLNAQNYSSTVNLGQHSLAIREVRSNAITGNIGWNSLAGVGVIYHNYLAKQMGLEVGIGLATTGFKFGGRFSYLFSEKNFSPFVSGGFMYGLGFGDIEIDFENENTGNSFSYTISSSPFAQIGGGIEYMSDKGFLISGILGYAILLKDSNYEITKGAPTKDEISAMDIAIGSGVVIELTIGYAFGGK
jgi:hypothetical protein